MAKLVNSIYALLEQRASQHPGKVALVHDGAAMTYGELLAEVRRHAVLLHRLGVGRGCRVGIHLRKSIPEVVATLSTAALGAVFVNITYQWTSRQARHIVEDCGIRHIVTDGAKAASLAVELPASLIDRFVVTDAGGAGDRITPWNDAADGADERAFAYDPISNDLAALLYTSGSTGSPKGVMVTQRNLLDGARIVSSYLGLEPTDRILSVPPFSFDYGLNQLIDALWVGATLVLQAVPLPAEILDAVERHEVTVLPLVAPSWVQVIQLLQESPRGLPALRTCTNTGGKIPTDLLAHVPSLLGQARFFLMYGLTEAFRSTYLPPELFREKMGAIGRAIPDNEIFVVDPERGICGPNEPGELIHRGCLVSRGYWGRPDLTAERVHPNPHLRPLIGDEPVVHSGDLVRRDEDGILWFLARRDEMIKCSGYRISPTEVEDIVAGCPGVREAIAFGVDDRALGQVVHIAVACSDDGTTVDSILAFCRRNMPSYMVPAVVHARGAALPRTGNGKLDRVRIRNDCLAAGALSPA
jgi:acyl-CoA synthetase (AMP-forming)/AMP-acid ligase II